MERVKVYSGSGTSFKMGSGLFAKAFKEHFPLLPTEDEGRLQDPGIRENFIERVFVYHRWQEFVDQGGRIAGLVTFHTAHKYLIMSHSSRHLKELGVLVSNAKKYEGAELLARYFMTLMDGLRLMATPKKHANVLQHLAGYFKKQLSSSGKTGASRGDRTVPRGSCASDRSAHAYPALCQEIRGALSQPASTTWIPTPRADAQEPCVSRLGRPQHNPRIIALHCISRCIDCIIM